MVLLHFRNEVETQFIVETTTDASVDEVTALVSEIHNERLRLMRLAQALEDLAKSGPVDVDAQALAGSPGDGEGKGKEEEEEEEGGEGGEGRSSGGVGMGGGPDSDDENETGGAASARAVAVARVGVAPAEEMAELLVRVAGEIRAAIAPTLAERREVLSREAMEGAEERAKGVVVLAYGDGLPETDPVALILDRNEVLDGTSMAKLVFDPDEAVIWWAKKKMERNAGGVLSDYIGTNEKTKLIIKMRKNAAMHPPPRDPPITEEERKNMLAYWYRKQEEEKIMAEDDEESYLAESWANPNALRSQLTGVDIHI